MVTGVPAPDGGVGELPDEYSYPIAPVTAVHAILAVVLVIAVADIFVGALHAGALLVVKAKLLQAEKLLPPQTARTCR